MKFRGLRADEIEVRVERATKSGVVLLLYKNARVDMAVLDETVGAENWRRDHVVIHDNLFCNLSIWDSEKGQWITKQDVGVESFAAKEKGEASDSFKRAGACWGIGRELYTAPFIFIPCKTKQRDSGKGYDLDNPNEFKGVFVSHINYDESVGSRIIKELAIADKKGNLVYTNTGKSIKPLDPTEPSGEPEDINERISLIQKCALEKRMKELDYTELRICNYYGIQNLLEMTVAQWVNCNEQLARIEEKRRKAKKDEK